MTPTATTRARAAIAGVLMLTVVPLALSQSSRVEGPLAALEVMSGTWTADGQGFSTALTYRWLLPGSVLEASNDVRGADGRVLARYRGAYAWDAGRKEIVFWAAGETGEVHRGRAWWKDGVLWHEAEVSGGRVDRYASAVRPGDGRLDYFAAYGTARAEPALLDSTPIVYRRR